MYIHTYNEDPPDSTNENIRLILMRQVSMHLDITMSVSSDIVRWYVKLYDFEESRILIRIYSEYLKVER